MAENLTLAERMADYARWLTFQKLPAAVIHDVKRLVIDSLGCAVGAFHEEPCVIARRTASAFSAQRGPTLWGTRHLAPPDWAAFVNGSMVRYFDYNDTYLSKEPAHPSDNIPASFAVAQSVGATGQDLITAIVIAYEVQCRLCDAASIRARGWDHPTYGCFSTALAAAKLMSLDRAQTVNAMGIAGVNSAALRQSRVGMLSHWKGCAFANAARHGVFAAMLAREGMTGPSPIFEGEKGFEVLVSGPLDIAGPFALDVRPGEMDTDDFMIRQVCIKYWPAEYHSQSAIAAALELRTQLRSTDEIESVLVQSHDAAVDIIGSEVEKWHPTSRETADHSLPYITAAALMDGDIAAAQFDPARLADPKLQALVQKVTIERHDGLSALYPGAVANIVTLRLRDGRILTKRIDHPPGHARNRITDAQVEGKFHRLVDPIIGIDRAGAIIQWVWRMGEATQLESLLSLLEMIEERGA